jgi:hypothetical protein
MKIIKVKIVMKDQVDLGSAGERESVLEAIKSLDILSGISDSEYSVRVTCENKPEPSDKNSGEIK